VHLLLGSPQDPCCLRVRNALEARDYPTHTIANPLAHPWRFQLQLNEERTASQLGGIDELRIRDDHDPRLWRTGR